MRTKFLFCLFVYLSVGALLKVLSDSCLPDRGSRVFVWESAPATVCSIVKEQDERARLAVAYRQAHASWLRTSDREASIPLLNAGLRLVITPTMVMTELPANRSVLLATSLCASFFAFVTAYLWALLDGASSAPDRRRVPTSSARTMNSAVLRIKSGYEERNDDGEE